MRKSKGSSISSPKNYFPDKVNGFAWVSLQHVEELVLPRIIGWFTFQICVLPKDRPFLQGSPPPDPLRLC